MDIESDSEALGQQQEQEIKSLPSPGLVRKAIKRIFETRQGWPEGGSSPR